MLPRCETCAYKCFVVSSHAFLLPISQSSPFNFFTLCSPRSRHSHHSHRVPLTLRGPTFSSFNISLSYLWWLSSHLYARVYITALIIAGVIDVSSLHLYMSINYRLEWTCRAFFFFFAWVNIRIAIEKRSAAAVPLIPFWYTVNTKCGIKSKQKTKECWLHCATIRFDANNLFNCTRCYAFCRTGY